MIYCLDTNVFIQAWNGYYARDFFPDYWDSLDQLAQKGIVFATEEVKKEIEDIDDDLKEWINDYALIRQLGWSFSINNKK